MVLPKVYHNRYSLLPQKSYGSKYVRTYRSITNKHGFFTEIMRTIQYSTYWRERIFCRTAPDYSHRNRHVISQV